MSDSIILVDDEPEFSEELSVFLESHGIQCQLISDICRILPRIREIDPDLIVLDQNLGPTTGIEILRDVRKTSQVPCIILTGLQDPIDRILGLELGADDYITKSAMPREILARIRAVLRRTRTVDWQGGGGDSPRSGSGAWDFRLSERELYRPDGRPCHLTSAEFGLLQALIEARGQPVDREFLTERIFNRPYRAGDRGVDGLVVKVRRKVESDPANPVVIKSARQQGYVFTGFAPLLVTH